MPSEHPRTDDWSSSVPEESEVQKKVWARGTKSVTLSMLSEDKHSKTREEVQGIGRRVHQCLLVREMKKNQQRKPRESN